MEFRESIQIIKIILGQLGSVINTDDYDGLIVKRLEKSNTLDQNRVTKQSHIAITGEQMDMFPYVRADGYFEVDYGKLDPDLKKYFVAQIQVYLHKENVEYLSGDQSFFDENEKLVHVSIVRSRRYNSSDQIQMSMMYVDSPEYITYRKMVHAGSYMIMLKRKKALLYDLFCVKDVDISYNGASLVSINNTFAKLPTSTVVHLDEIIQSKCNNDGNANESQNGYQRSGKTSVGFVYESGSGIYKDDDDLVTDSKTVKFEKLKTCMEVIRKPRQSKRYPVNFIIYGAPGTGKTYSTAEYALAIIEDREVNLAPNTYDERLKIMAEYNKRVHDGQVVFTTFHQSYGYEEFIQGLRLDTKSENMSFEVVDGVFKRIADRALNDLDNNYVIIIDEINRANISKVFGELITLIEEDKRWGEHNQLCATLQSGDVFAVPNNLYIVGTMNSADKSISLIDAALRRRFDFFEQKPQPELVSDPQLKEVLISLNSSLVDELDSTDLLIGHSYFMNRTMDDLASILNNSIIPLLYEYFYDNKKKVGYVLSKAIETTDVSIVDDKMGRLSVKKTEA